MPKDPNKGGGNGGGGGGGGGLIGTPGDDRLKGTSADDILIGYAGDDQIDGGDGWDTALYEGSINDFDFRYGHRGIVYVTDLNTADGDEGYDSLKNIETVQFNDYSINLNGDNPTVLTAPTTVYATAGEEFSFDVSAYDVDDSVFVEIYDRGTWNDKLQWDSSRETLAEYGSVMDYTLNVSQNATADWLGVADFSRGYLALGETESHTITLRAGSNTAGWTYQDVEIIFTGVNDAPTLAAINAMAVTEDGGPVQYDLTQYAGDVDSDDDALSLTYIVSGLPAGVTGTVTNGVLTLDPGTSFQFLEGDESLDFTFQVQVMDQHGAVSELRDVSLTVHGETDPLTDFLNPDGSINYTAVGVDPASAPNLGTVFGNNAANIPAGLLDFTEGDDTRVIVSETLEGFRDYGYDTDGDGIDNNSAFVTGGGNDHLAFVQTGLGTSLKGIDIATGDGRDLVTFDLASSAVEFVDANVSTGAGSDQIHIRAQTDGIIQVGFHDISTGSGDDLFTWVMDGTYNDFSALGLTTATNVSLGTGNDTFVLDLNVQNAVWGDISIDLDAGDGDDMVRLDNADTTLALDYPLTSAIRGGLDGNRYDMGRGDDTLVLNIHDAGPNGAEAILWGGEGYDLLLFDTLDADQFTVTETSTGSYTITQGTQTYYVHGFEDIATLDGSLIDVV